MRTTFILLRHAESQANKLGIVQGVGLAVPLTEAGHEQARAAARGLAGERVDRVFVSPAVRTRDTAAPLREQFAAVPFLELGEIIERSKGVAEGMQKSAFALQYPEVEAAWARGEDPRPEGGESFADVERRVLPVLTRHAREHAGETLLYVTHGNVIRVVLGHVLGMPHGKRGSIAQRYCAYNRFSYDADAGTWTVEVVDADPACLVPPAGGRLSV